ncbi:SDR family NAD(P)-dependent oxidoreductase [Streptomyces sp. NPDC002911]
MTQTTVITGGNSGIGEEFACRFAEATDEGAAAVALNVTAVGDLSKAFYPDLLRTESVMLVNVADVAGHAPFAGMAVYSAAKAFVITPTEALWAEARGSRLRVPCLSPGATTSEFFDIPGTPTKGIGFQSPAQGGRHRPAHPGNQWSLRVLPRSLAVILAARQAPEPAAGLLG